ncbi:8233_t:CDS:2, partial [Dentiscutata erythropus]
MTVTHNDIQEREILTTLIADCTFSPLWTRKRFIIWMDNQANVEAYYSRLEHIAGKSNVDADLLSRSSHKEFMIKNPLSYYLQPNMPL